MRKLFFYSSVIAILANSCAYRFSNVVMIPPKGISSITVEAIYDTSQEVIPHEILWQAMQRSFAENGRLKLTDHRNADALVRAHIQSARINPTGTPSRTTESKDPIMDNSKIPPSPTEIKKITRASSWTTEEAVALSVLIEIWDLNIGKVVFKKNYAETVNFKSYRSSDQALSQTHYLLFEEGQNAKLLEISKRIADKTVADFLL